MCVTLEDERVIVDVPDVDVEDFLEYAELAIQRYGWRRGERTKVSDDNMVEVAEKEGLSLHDSIGYTNVMLGGDTTGKPTGKDAVTPTRVATFGRSMRSEMTTAINAVLPEGETDLTFNDKAKNVGEVLGVLRQARGAA
jgi:hypothetical protein